MTSTTVPSREMRCLAVIVVIAALLRVLVFAELSETSAFDLHRWAQSDMNFFHSWGNAVASGDVLSADVGHPVHEWHRAIADATAQRRGLAPADSDAFATALWDDWYGGTRLHQEPLYPYGLGVVFALGGGVGVVFAVQVLLGLGNVILVWAITRRVFDPASALVAAGGAALCAPLVFFETVLLRATLVTTIGLVLVLVASIALERGRRWWWATGGMLGLAVLTRTVFGFMGVGIVVALIARRRRAGVRPVVAMAAGALVVVLPVLVRNLVVSAPVAGLTSVNAVTFMTSNLHGYDPAGAFDVAIDEAARILDETDGAGWPTAVATLRTHPGIGSVIALVAGKAWSIFHGWEKPNNVSFDFHRRLSRTLAVLPVTFGVVAPLALAGAVLGRRRDGAAATVLPLVLLAATLVVTMLVAYVLARFRLPLLAALLPFAGAAVVTLVRDVRAARWSRVAIACLLVAPAALAIQRDHPRVRLADYAAAFEVHFAPRAQDAASRGDREAERAALEDYLALEPDDFPSGAEGEQLRRSFEIVRAMRDRVR